MAGKSNRTAASQLSRLKKFLRKNYKNQIKKLHQQSNNYKKKRNKRKLRNKFNKTLKIHVNSNLMQKIKLKVVENQPMKKDREDQKSPKLRIDQSYVTKVNKRKSRRTKSIMDNPILNHKSSKLQKYKSQDFQQAHQTKIREKAL